MDTLSPEPNAESRFIDAGEGTPEALWLASPRLAAAPIVSPQALVPAGARAVVVAPHPDDELLSVGGILASLCALGRETCVVAVTDGEASHPGSDLWTGAELAAVRREESRVALGRLGINEAPLRLGLPDGGLRDVADALTALLQELLRPDDVVFSTWRLDGHPDHEASARACAQATAAVGCRFIEVPVWAWHWARPDDSRWPWARARRVPLGTDAMQRKQHAVAAYRSQIEPDPTTGADPILRRSTLARAARSFELVLA